MCCKMFLCDGSTRFKHGAIGKRVYRVDQLQLYAVGFTAQVWGGDKGWTPIDTASAQINLEIE